jgi:hypothetical protein
MKLVAVGDERQSHHAYWQREALVYQSGLLDDLPDGLAAPRCFGIDTLPEGGRCFWLEEIVENTGENWNVSRYGLAARHFGRLNGRYLTGRPAPSQPWLSRRRFRDQFAEWLSFHAWIDDPNTWSDPRIHHAFRRPVAERLLRLWNERSRFLDALDRLPQTFCHEDAWRGNLLSRCTSLGQDETVALDWALAGIGAIGQEMGALVFANLLQCQVEASDAPMLAEAVLEGYLDGLADVGWRGDLRLARLGYAASSVFHAGIDLPWVIQLALAERDPAVVIERWGRPLDALMEHWAAVAEFLLSAAADARRLFDAQP